MDLSMNGKKIAQVWWPDTDTEQDRNIKTSPENVIMFSATHHGDHDEFWIIETDASGVEKGRHNPRFVETIYWK